MKGKLAPPPLSPASSERDNQLTIKPHVPRHCFEYSFLCWSDCLRDLVLLENLRVVRAVYRTFRKASRGSVFQSLEINLVQPFVVAAAVLVACRFLSGFSSGHPRTLVGRAFLWSAAAASPASSFSAGLAYPSAVKNEPVHSVNLGRTCLIIGGQRSLGLASKSFARPGRVVAWGCVRPSVRSGQPKHPCARHQHHHRCAPLPLRFQVGTPLPRQRSGANTADGQGGDDRRPLLISELFAPPESATH